MGRDLAGFGAVRTVLATTLLVALLAVVPIAHATVVVFPLPADAVDVLVVLVPGLERRAGGVAIRRAR